MFTFSWANPTRFNVVFIGNLAGKHTHAIVNVFLIENNRGKIDYLKSICKSANYRWWEKEEKE
jgi:hypothetical protein